MATVRMQFDHEEEEDEVPNRADNNRAIRHDARVSLGRRRRPSDSTDAIPRPAARSLPQQVAVRSAPLPVSPLVTSVLPRPVLQPVRRISRLYRNIDAVTMGEHLPGNWPEPKWTNGSDWIHALESGNLITAAERDEYRDISFRGNWTLSSCKIDGDGFGVNELLSDSVDSYWQSDGPQPHMITVEFPRKTDISFLALFLDFKSDESYTPNKVLVRLGSSLMHLDDQFEHDLNEPVGWQILDLRRGSYAKRAFVLQLHVVQNHQNGRDTHIRHMRVVGPSRSRFDPVKRSLVTPQVHNLLRNTEPEIGDENGDPILNNLRHVPEPPLMPVSSLSSKLQLMRMIR